MLNKIDAFHEELSQKPSLVFRSRPVKNKVNVVSEYMGLNENCVLPMKNYTTEKNATTDVNILALYNLKQILNACDDTIANLMKGKVHGKFEGNTFYMSLRMF